MYIMIVYVWLHIAILPPTLLPEAPTVITQQSHLHSAVVLPPTLLPEAPAVVAEQSHLYTAVVGHRSCSVNPVPTTTAVHCTC